MANTAACVLLGAAALVLAFIYFCIFLAMATKDDEDDEV